MLWFIILLLFNKLFSFRILHSYFITLYFSFHFSIYTINWFLYIWYSFIIPLYFSTRLISKLTTHRFFSKLRFGLFVPLGKDIVITTTCCCFSKHIFKQFMLLKISNWYEILLNYTVFTTTRLSYFETINFIVEWYLIFFHLTAWFWTLLTNLMLWTVLFRYSFDVLLGFLTFFFCRATTYSGMNGTIRRYFGMIWWIFTTIRAHFNVLHFLDGDISLFMSYLFLSTIFHLEN